MGSGLAAIRWAWVIAAAFGLLAASSSAAAEAIGRIADKTPGGAEIQRNAITLLMERGSAIEMNDVVRTDGASARVVFNDQSTLTISEQSVVHIDKFVYNPDSQQSAGTMGLRVAMGTARFVTGKIGQLQPANVGVRTPVATVGIRGTDFSMTVDEIGRTLVILLPTCPRGTTNIDSCKVGRIEVSSDEATVVLSSAFQATLVSSREEPPSPPSILNLTESQVNNLLIVASPPEVRSSAPNPAAAVERDALATGNLLADALQENLLAANDLDANALGTGDLLGDELARTSEQIEATLATIAEVGELVKGIDVGSGLTGAISDNTITIGRQDASASTNMSFPKQGKGTIILNQNGTIATLTVNGGGGNVLSITQTQ